MPPSNGDSESKMKTSLLDLPNELLLHVAEDVLNDFAPGRRLTTRNKSIKDTEKTGSTGLGLLGVNCRLRDAMLDRMLWLCSFTLTSLETEELLKLDPHMVEKMRHLRIYERDPAESIFTNKCRARGFPRKVLLHAPRLQTLAIDVEPFFTNNAQVRHDGLARALRAFGLEGLAKWRCTSFANYELASQAALHKPRKGQWLTPEALKKLTFQIPVLINAWNHVSNLDLSAPVTITNAHVLGPGHNRQTACAILNATLVRDRICCEKLPLHVQQALMRDVARDLDKPEVFRGGVLDEGEQMTGCLPRTTGSKGDHMLAVGYVELLAYLMSREREQVEAKGWDGDRELRGVWLQKVEIS